MCLACDEADMFYRWQLLQQIAKGVLPEGVSEDELRTMGLPLPSEVELVEEPDGTKILKQKAPAANALNSGARTADKFTQSAQGLIAPAKPAPTFAERAFTCDSPDE